MSGNERRSDPPSARCYCEYVIVGSFSRPEYESGSHLGTTKNAYRRPHVAIQVLRDITHRPTAGGTITYISFSKPTQFAALGVERNPASVRRISRRKILAGLNH